MWPGEIVEVRSVFGGRVRWAFPHRVVADDGQTLALYLAPGAEGVWMGRDADGKYLDRWVRGDDPHAHVWRYHHVLSLTRRGDAHSLWLLWEEDWTFRCWYVQLWKPVVETQSGLETMDHALDVLVDPDGTWRWKDEDDFVEAQALGIFTSEEASAIRAEGERVIAAKPWPTGWEDWRP
ncbi:MAG: DUF402 domain-containing protein [Gaiellaceae bacterium]